MDADVDETDIIPAWTEEFEQRLTLDGTVMANKGAKQAISLMRQTCERLPIYVDDLPTSIYG